MTERTESGRSMMSSHENRSTTQPARTNSVYRRTSLR